MRIFSNLRQLRTQKAPRLASFRELSINLMVLPKGSHEFAEDSRKNGIDPYVLKQTHCNCMAVSW